MCQPHRVTCPRLRYCPVPERAPGTFTAQGLESLPSSTRVCSLLRLCLDPSRQQIPQLSSWDPLTAGRQPAWFPSLRVGRWFLSNEAPFQGRLLTCSSIARWSPYLFCSHAPSETLMIPKPL